MTHLKRWFPLLGTVALANLFWFISFSVNLGSFWIKISLSAATLAFLARLLTSGKKFLGSWDRKTLYWGLGSAALLYVLFWTGKILSTHFLPFAQPQIDSIYRLGDPTPFWLMVTLALLVTGPSEEYFWRGFVQRQLMEKFGNRRGWLMGAVLYGSVHIWSFNVMLIAAACVAGAFWGGLYWRTRTLLPVVISHSVWSVLAFTVFPFG